MERDPFLRRNPRRSWLAVWRWPPWVWGAIVPLMLVSYPLSGGPVNWLFYRGYLPPSFEAVTKVVYRPMTLARESFPLLDVVLWRYEEWWILLAIQQNEADAAARQFAIDFPLE